MPAQVFALVEDLGLSGPAFARRAVEREEIPVSPRVADLAITLLQMLLHEGVRILLAQGDCVLVVNSEIQVPAGPHDPAQLQQPGLGEVGDVREHRSGVDEVEVAILERQVGEARGSGELEWGAQVLLAPDHVRTADIHAPDFAAVACVGFEPPDHDPGGSTEIQDALAGGQRATRLIEDARHVVDVFLASREIALFGIDVSPPQILGGNRQPRG